MSRGKNARILVAIFCASLVLSSSGLAQSVKKSAAAASIGTATMLDNGTIELRLIARDHGIIGHSTLRYAPDHKQYKDILRHLGGLKPGEVKSVPPWPEK
jgi:hypothetical protein